ncbi:GTP pyrophosphokinase [Thermodesulfobium acidiphilum]|uniref:GTP pyrophosphokinase n=1 Tax=Thermodesulfobium acidiphilum TaxID=1794699 RepID=A0A2R4VYG4_THEAF|nr:bifunctional (p)ppGpp synthetase/guanosine-3',5'-bis(diphosphate) 3'-pyrophosphohydrolase [Thermodesulfobium acidiphilum]AWB09577.1 GTP pyrophosphokinase [Thermodesulfobium acidiphilum]
MSVNQEKKLNTLKKPSDEKESVKNLGADLAVNNSGSDIQALSEVEPNLEELFSNFPGLKELLDGFDESEREFLLRCFVFAYSRHGDQRRLSGEPYIYHPLNVALILKEVGMDYRCLGAAILHDVLEDTQTSPEEIKANFGEDILVLVDGVTKLGKLRFKSPRERQAESFRKMFVAMAKDIRVVVIKLADRLHNMRTLEILANEKKEHIANETLKIFAPLAHRLGMWVIKSELEDLALYYLDRDMFNHILMYMESNINNHVNFLSKIEGILQESFQKELNCNFKIKRRKKHIYSVYQKLKRTNKSIDDIYDIFGLRIIIGEDVEGEDPYISSCYHVLGIIHSLFPPIPGRFKDFIAAPKPNNYQSLHTTVLGPGGIRVEIQIRTAKMDRIAEVGVAAHWLYKERKTSSIRDINELKLIWLRQLLEWQSDIKGAEFMDMVESSFNEEEIFVFTPQGDILDLEADSTPIDFAYRIHTEVGNKCIGAKVNSKMVALNTPLQTGDVVEIVTSKNAKPHLSWLNFVKTSLARQRIKSYFKKEHKNEAVLAGRQKILKELSRLNIVIEENQRQNLILEVAKKLNFASADDLLAAVGFEDISAHSVVNKIKDMIVKPEETLPTFKAKEVTKKKDDVIKIGDIGGLEVTFAKCCGPVPGDRIKGYVSRGRGLIVHRENCPNLLKQIAREGNDRIVDLNWNNQLKAESYESYMIVEGTDRVGFMKDILIRVASLNVNVVKASVNTNKAKKKVYMILEVQLKDNLEREKLIKELREVPDVIDVRQRGE